MKLTYFAHDLSDATVQKRVRMLKMGGADVRIIGFRRSAQPVREINGISAVDLGQTYEGRLTGRAWLVARQSFAIGLLRELTEGSSVLLARNLEMCTIAEAARLWTRGKPRLVYECLDIHSAFSSDGLGSKALKAWERQILRRASGLIVSSPGFLKNYFAKHNIKLPKTLVLENKIFAAGPRPSIQKRENVRNRPWRIGWYGLIRCEKSYKALYALAKLRPNLIDVDMRGLPTARLQHLMETSPPLANMRFGGKYSQQELPLLYANVDFAWVVDYFDEGKNSSWLLPNRIYESSYYGCPCIALAETETAEWLLRHGCGKILVDLADIEDDIVDIDDEEYVKLINAVHAIKISDLMWTSEECKNIVNSL